MAKMLIGHVKGPKGDQGLTGDTGAQGLAATIEVGTVSTTAYGTAAQVTNSGSESEAIFDFVIPEGAPGATVTDMSNLTLNTLTASTSTFPVVTVGDTGRVAFGKVNKYLSDLKSAVQQPPTAITVTPGTGVTNNRVWAYQIGKMVWISGSITTTETLASNSTLWAGLPGLDQSVTGRTICDLVAQAGGAAQTFYINSSGELHNAGALAAGTWAFNATYLAS